MLVCFYEKHFTFLTSHIYFHVDKSELYKQHQFVSQEMMEQICDSETVKPQETPVKVCVIFCNIEICYWGCGEYTQMCCRLIDGLQILNSVLDKFYCWDSRNETLIAHYEEKNRNHHKLSYFEKMISHFEYIQHNFIFRLKMSWTGLTYSSSGIKTELGKQIYRIFQRTA